MKSFRLGLVGCGRVSPNHLNAFKDHPGAQWTAVCDTNPTAAHNRATEWQIPHWYTDFHEMMKAHPDLDVVVVATPSGCHAEHVIALAPYGKNIVVEKPMALRVEDCDAMLRACNASGSRLFTVKQNRFNPAVAAVRQAFEQGRFGKMVSCAVYCRWKREQPYYEDGWHGTWHMDGGVMAQQACHHLDLLQWFMGPVDAMTCFRAARLMKLEAEDTAVAAFHFTSGALGTFEATTASRPESLGASITLLGEKGHAVIEGEAVNLLTRWQFQDEAPEDAAIRENVSQAIPNCYGNGHAPYLADVLDAIADNRPGLVEGPEGRKTVAILAALYESSFHGGAPVAPGCPVTRSPLGLPSRALPPQTDVSGSCSR